MARIPEAELDRLKCEVSLVKGKIRDRPHLSCRKQSERRQPERYRCLHV